eukprot:GFYU01002384.1.p1 GENE.GFYU01002384.1~~GFYU01002384.1.p1  ORF type:complete len:191 (-),score=17.73 GFYU01002384.1:394-966(-)
MEFIIVLGNSDPDISKRRVDRAVEEFYKSPHENVDPVTKCRTRRKILLFSGACCSNGSGMYVPGSRKVKAKVAEGTMMMQHARKQGVDDWFMYAETESRTTMENLSNCKALIESLYPQPMEGGSTRLTICTSTFHVKRTMVLSQYLLPQYQTRFIHTREIVPADVQAHEWKILNHTLNYWCEKELQQQIH